MYEAMLEKRRGPLGIVRQRIPVGQLSTEKPVINHELGDASITLFLDQHQILTIRSDQPTIVEFAAEPLRYRPKTVVKLDEYNPEILTNRRHVTICTEADRNERLILTAPKFQPLFVTTREAAIEIVDALYSKI